MNYLLGSKLLSLIHTKKESKQPKFNINFRMIIFLVFSLLLRWPIWIILYILKPFKFFDYLFLVYPGTDNDLEGYCPKIIARSWLFSAKPVIGGVISKGKVGRGIVLVVPNTTSGLYKSKKVCENIIRRLNFLKSLTGVKSIALAGRIPSIMNFHNIKLEEPFVQGTKGTVFCINDTLDRVMQKKGFSIGSKKILVFGVGYTGSALMDYLRKRGHEVIGVDVKPSKKRNVYSVNNYNLFSKVNIIIVLAAKGSDFIPLLPYCSSNTIVLDDTHPKINSFSAKLEFYKIAIKMDGVKFFPRLPGYQSHWIPGCALEAMCNAVTGDFNKSQEIFNSTAKELGFVSCV